MSADHDTEGDHEPFNIARTRDLIMEVGPPAVEYSVAECSARLTAIMQTFAMERLRFERSHPKTVMSACERLAAACQMVLDASGIGEAEVSGDALHEGLGIGGLYAAAMVRGEESGQVATLNAFAAVRTLREDALAVGQRAKARVSKGPRPDRPLEHCIRLLADFYSDTWELRPTINRGANVVAWGPFVRLLLAFNRRASEIGVDRRRDADPLAKIWEGSPSYHLDRSLYRSVE